MCDVAWEYVLYLHRVAKAVVWPGLVQILYQIMVPFGSQKDLYNSCTNLCHCTNRFGQYDFHKFLYRPCTNRCHCMNRDLATKSIRTRFGTSICYISCIPYVSLTNHTAAHNNQQKQKTTTTHSHYPILCHRTMANAPPHQALGKKTITSSSWRRRRGRASTSMCCRCCRPTGGSSPRSK